MLVKASKRGRGRGIPRQSPISQIGTLKESSFFDHPEIIFLGKFTAEP
jgi:hypothetical protein